MNIKLNIPQVQLPFEMLTIPAPSGYENALTMFYLTAQEGSHLFNVEDELRYI